MATYGLPCITPCVSTVHALRLTQGGSAIFSGPLSATTGTFTGHVELNSTCTIDVNNAGSDAQFLMHNSNNAHLSFLSGNSAGGHDGDNPGNTLIDFRKTRDFLIGASDNTGLSNRANYLTIAGDTGAVTIAGNLTQTAGVIVLNDGAVNNATQYLQYQASHNDNLFVLNGGTQGRVGIGAAVSSFTTCYVGNTMTHHWTGGSGRGMWIDPGHTPNVSQWAYGEVLRVQGAINGGADPGSGWRTHPWFRGTYFQPPTITAGTATVDNSATVYIEQAMSCATNNYSLYVYSGQSYFGGNCAAPSWQVLSSAQGSEVGSIYWANSGMSIRSGNSGDAQFILKGGSVGIGINAPLHQLHILSTAAQDTANMIAKFTNATGDAGLEISGTNDNTEGVYGGKPFGGLFRITEPI